MASTDTVTAMAMVIATVMATDTANVTAMAEVTTMDIMTRNTNTRNTDKNKEWFAIYVKSRYEKKVSKALDEIGVESFLPIVTRIKQWSDRKKKVDEPLFRSYVFVHITKEDYYNVLHCDGVVKFITFEGKAAIIPDNQILAIKDYISDSDSNDMEMEYDEFKEGQLVRIKSGHLKGLTGRFIEIRGRHRLIVNIEVVGKSIPINVVRSNIEVVQEVKAI